MNTFVKLQALTILNMDFVRSHFFTNEPLTSRTLFFSQFGVPYSIQVPQIEEKSV